VERNRLDDLEVDGKIILRWIFKKWDGDMDCIDLAHDKDGWRDVVNLRIS
jgi:hypothetical protein